MVNFALVVALPVMASAKAPASYGKDQLEPLTKFRQQHRRTVDGRLCAAAFVQHRQLYTGCTDAPAPNSVSGRPWCYVEPQLGVGDSAWGYCAPVVDYGALRAGNKRTIAAKVEEVKKYVAKLKKAELAAQNTLDMYAKKCA